MDIIRIDPDFTPETHTVGTSSAQSSAITTQSGVIRITTKGCEAHVAFGTNPTATNNSVLVPANSVQYFAFVSGQKVAFLRSASSSGEINICAVD